MCMERLYKEKDESELDMRVQGVILNMGKGSKKSVLHKWKKL